MSPVGPILFTWWQNNPTHPVSLKEQNAKISRFVFVIFNRNYSYCSSRKRKIHLALSYTVASGVSGSLRVWQAKTVITYYHNALLSESNELPLSQPIGEQ